MTTPAPPPTPTAPSAGLPVPAPDAVSTSVAPAETWSPERLEAGAPLVSVPQGTEAAIQIHGLQRSFGPRQILRGINLEVARGETVVIIGGSGSGKTTLIRHLMAALLPPPDCVWINGVDIGRAKADELDRIHRSLGVVFQNAALLNSLTILENVGLPLSEVERRPAAEIRTRVVQALRQVYLPAEEILALKPANLSGGMRKRVGIARAIIQHPAIVLYDEPTTGLDPVTVNGVNELIIQLQRMLGVTSIVITHDMAAARMIANRIAVLYKGRLIAVGDQAAIAECPHPVVRQLLSGSTHGPLTEGYVA